MPEDTLSVPPLNADEKKWVNRLQRTLAACPERLELITIGDPHLEVTDSSVTVKLDDICDGKASEGGFVLAMVEGKPHVHGVSG